jgi:uncharacterized protein YbjT (DUF2867 family)
MTTENANKSGLILVLGAHGKTGSRVMERLRGAQRNVRIGSRSASPSFDWHDRSGWPAVLHGVDAVYVTYQPDLCEPGAVAIVTAFFDAAAKAGVKKIVLLSGRGEPEAEDAERALQATPVDWTIIRASWFFQNFSENYFIDDILAGEVVMPEGLAPEPFVDVEDIADIAAQALTGSHSRALYEVTGPKAITFAEAIGEVGRATGRSIGFRTIPLADYRQRLIDAQLSPEMADLIIYLFTTVLDGRNISPTDGVAQALGRPPRTFADYVARTAATGVWQVKS